jgi:hypothetical protein
MSTQTTDTILMIRPVNFRLNEETAVNNYYQKSLTGVTSEDVNQRAAREFDNFVTTLRDHDIRVIVIDDTPEPSTPDSIFPNNWISFHQDGRVGLYPMFAPNRRLERRNDILEQLQDSYQLRVASIHDFSHYESENVYLEGTGSMVLDRENKIAYAAISERTDADAFREFCQKFSYTPVMFTANQDVNGKRLSIYHTNVMMCVADRFAVLCADTIDDPLERQAVIASLEQTGKEIIYITEDQKHHFAGNMLQVHARNNPEKKYLVMSEAAYSSLTDTQRTAIEKYGKIIHSSLDTIETLGGGSARCMMAEVFLPENKN